MLVIVSLKEKLFHGVIFSVISAKTFEKIVISKKRNTALICTSNAIQPARVGVGSYPPR